MKTFDRKDVFSVANAEEAQKYIGKEGYFADRLSELTEAVEGLALSLDEIDLESDMPYCSYGEGASQLFIPIDKVKEDEEEKNYRPFTSDEFLAKFKVGEAIQIKISPLGEITTLITSVRRNANQLTLGGFDNECFETLFSNGVQILLDGKWQPFGVKDES